MTYLQTNDLVKIRFPSNLTKQYWAIEEKSKKTTFAVPKLAVLIAVACVKPRTREDLFYDLQKKYYYDINKIEKILNSLISKNIIYELCHSQKFCNNVAKWRKSGWGAAADYHFFTWDAPFLDYSKNGAGYDIDRKNMLRYHQEQEDRERCKSYSVFFNKLSLSEPISVSLPENIKKLLAIDRIKLLLSLAFGKSGEKPCHWSSVPLMRRTSPSGGCRHPTEGYFLSISNEIPKGIYHIQADPTTLVHISHFSEDDHIFVNESPTCLGAIILTSIFERNMYRYREPRTFRTIHMDTGHLIETINMLAIEFGFEAIVQMNFDENKILKRIQSSKFEEGVIAIITLEEGISK